MKLVLIWQVPLDTNAFVTLWIPLRAMDDDDSGLLFASGKSHPNNRWHQHLGCARLTGPDACFAWVEGGAELVFPTVGLHCEGPRSFHTGTLCAACFKSLRPSTFCSDRTIAGSHRDFALAYWQDLEGMDDLERREYPLEDHGALDLGDATCHHGWCLHYASPQSEDSEPRAALSVSYFAEGAKVLDTRHAR